jgi:hypothetical protein
MVIAAKGKILCGIKDGSSYDFEKVGVHYTVT